MGYVEEENYKFQAPNSKQTRIQFTSATLWIKNFKDIWFMILSLTC